MSCGQSNIRLRNTAQDRSAPHRYSYFTRTVIVPVFCVCMLSAMGNAAVTCRSSTIACGASTDTEYILSYMMAVMTQTRHLSLDETDNPAT